MPVNTAALKSFAPAMRRQLLEAVGRKLDLLLNSQTPDILSTYAKQIAELREQVAENREQLLERVAYTWFNRLCALRYLDAKGWHPFGCKVLMPAAEGETQPELLKLMRAGSLPAELKPHTNEARLHGLLDGQIPPAIAGADPQGEVYRELVLASCRSYHQLLPELFEGLDDASELLLPDDLLSEGSMAGAFRSAISDEDCEDVEIIGWLYQFYISEKKDQVIGKVVKSEDIPAATQLFTPNWIVKYMVQNSLGATWLATYPNSPLKGQMDFYIEPAEQTPEAQAQLAAITPESLDPEALTLIDPACGSGHILVEAYELLKAIYLERGYRQRDIPELILTKNLYGLDICPRAAQLAAFSLLVKGRGDDRRLFERSIQLNVMALVNSNDLDVEGLASVINLAEHGLRPTSLMELKQLFENATTFGSLLQPPARLIESLPALRRLTDLSSQQIIAAKTLKALAHLVRQAEFLSSRYNSVVANPPYLGRKGMSPSLRAFLDDNYLQYRSDLFSAFISRLIDFSHREGAIGCMSPNVWMFIPSHEELRRLIVGTQDITTLVELPLSGFTGATVQICAFVLSNSAANASTGTYIRLIDFKGEENMAPMTLQAVKDPDCPWRYETKTKDMAKLDGSPIAYWISNEIRKIFQDNPQLGTLATPRSGITTGDNGLYIRYWYEVEKFNKDIKSNDYPEGIYDRWVPINGGSEYRKWYGSNLQVIDWENKGDRITRDPKSTIANLQYQFKPGVTWTKITSARLSVRLVDSGFIFTAVGLKAFPGEDLRNYTCGFLNSVVVEFFKPVFSSTVSILSGDIARLPFIVAPCKERVDLLVQEAVAIARRDWDSQEVSWDFDLHPLITPQNLKVSLEKSWQSYRDNCLQMVEQMLATEAEINEVFIRAYGLTGQMSSIPSEDLITLSRPSNDGDCRTFLSYATGCMMGRYSLEEPGLILADSNDSQASHLAAYEQKVGKPLHEVQFKPDPDGIIPVLDGEWFEDDIVARTREFLAVTFPESTVTENLRFIEESLGKDIRKYFCSEFYKDHLQTYKKRPIYWMVQSPKKGFACLVYLHRYTKDTLNQVLNNYFRPYLQKLEARLTQLGLDQLNEDLPTRERTAARKEAEKITKVLKECQAWEQDSLLPLAQQRIELDLDDGVKVNYLKLQDVLAPIPGLAAKED